MNGEGSLWSNYPSKANLPRQPSLSNHGRSVEIMPEEIWKDIPDYEGLYQASNLGRIRSMPREVCGHWGMSRIKGRFLSDKICRNGYRMAGLCKNGARYTYGHHRLVLMAFCGVSDLHVDHINGVRHDNRLENLEYVTRRENNRRGKNCLRKKDKICKYRNVRLSYSGKRYRAELTVNNVRHGLGTHDTEELAFQAVLDFEEKHSIS